MFTFSISFLFFFGFVEFGLPFFLDFGNVFFLLGERNVWVDKALFNILFGDVFFHMI